MSMKTKIGWRCAKCGSEILRFDATAVWNKVTQSFEIDDLCGYRECCECDSKDVEEYSYE